MPATGPFRITPGSTMNNFQDNLAGTDARTSSERHIANVREQGGVFVEAVRLTRMPMLVTDATLPGNPIIFTNRAFIELSGYTEDELLGQDPHFMNGEQTAADAIRQYETAINEGRDNTVEILQYRKDGKPFRAMLFASPLDNGHGRRGRVSPITFSPTSTSRAATMPNARFGPSPPSWRGA